MNLTKAGVAKMKPGPKPKAKAKKKVVKTKGKITAMLQGVAKAKKKTVSKVTKARKAN